MTGSTEADVVSKGQFAHLANVSPGRVSQWIAEGKIGGEALVGEGRNARIRVSIAQQQLRQRIDVGQRFGNGIDTNLSTPVAPAATIPPAPVDAVEERIKREKLREIEFRNRERAESELERRGTLMRAKDASAQMVGVASAMLNVFEGAMPDFASAIASRFGVPQRDVLHLLRVELRGVRERAAQAARKRMDGLSAEVVEDIEDPSDDEAGSPLQ